MPIISKVGRRSIGVRVLYAFILILLIAGSISMIYPMLLMFSGSVRGEGDAYSMRVIPEFLLDEKALYARYVEAKYNTWMEHARASCNTDYLSWNEFTPPEKIDHDLVALFQEFRASDRVPLSWKFLGENRGLSINMWQANLRRFNHAIRDYFGNDIVRARTELNLSAPNFNFIQSPWEKLDDRRYADPTGLYGQLWTEFKQGRPAHEFYLCDVDGFFRERFIYAKHGRDIDQYNQLHGTRHPSYDQVIVDNQVPPERAGLVRTEWLTFVREKLNGHFVRLDPRCADRYRSFLRGQYQDDISRLNWTYETTITTFEEIAVPLQFPRHTQQAADYLAFIKKHSEAEDLRVYGPRQAWERFLADERGLAMDQITPAALPTAMVDYVDMQQHRGAIKWEFLTRHYRYVLSYVMINGRAIYNTVIYCVLLIGVQLLFKPLAAYALSRFKLPSTYTLLLICLLTMAFPPEVIMIPSFLLLRSFPLWPLLAAAAATTTVTLVVSWLLRKLRPSAHRERRATLALFCGLLGGIVGWVWLWRLFGVAKADVSLLNTFYALILPSVAEGFSIFLLKGFFDSLPRELYESCDIDGASEWTKFWAITMNLSKPILAVLALGAFTSAYSNFMFALIVIPDQKMWTIMVWLYELQRNGHQSVVFASLVLAAVPTFLVFLFCQNIIMRGIVVPVEK